MRGHKKAPRFALRIDPQIEMGGVFVYQAWKLPNLVTWPLSNEQIEYQSAQFLAAQIL